MLWKIPSRTKLLYRNDLNIRINTLYHAFNSIERATRSCWAGSARSLIMYLQTITIQTSNLEPSSVSHQVWAHLFVTHFVYFYHPRIIRSLCFLASMNLFIFFNMGLRLSLSNRWSQLTKQFRPNGIAVLRHRHVSIYIININYVFNFEQGFCQFIIFNFTIFFVVLSNPVR